MKHKDVRFYFGHRFFAWEPPGYWIFGYVRNGSYRTIIRLKVKDVKAKRPPILDPNKRSVWELK